MASISGLTEPTLTNLFIDIAADNATSITNTVDDYRTFYGGGYR
jgi:hypothetical protein